MSVLAPDRKIPEELQRPDDHAFDMAAIDHRQFELAEVDRAAAGPDVFLDVGRPRKFRHNNRTKGLQIRNTIR